MREYLTVAEAAQMLGKSIPLIYSMIKNGTCPATEYRQGETPETPKQTYRSYMIARSWVEEQLEYITPSEYARQHGVSRQYVSILIHKGKLKYTLINNKKRIKRGG